eukprot:5345621-Prymnesium_polylepis.2
MPSTAELITSSSWFGMNSRAFSGAQNAMRNAATAAESAAHVASGAATTSRSTMRRFIGRSPSPVAKKPSRRSRRIAASS